MAKQVFCNTNIMILSFFLVFIPSCGTQRKYIAIDIQLKNHSLVQEYVQNPAYKTEFHDTDILLQRKNLGKRYTIMYLLSHKKEKNVTDSLFLFEVEAQNAKNTVVFPRTPSPLTPLMRAYYPEQTSKVYANTTAERLNYLYTNYAQKTWITILDTALCDKKWNKKLMRSKLYIIKMI